ncbi:MULTISPECIES: hypothetical protein [unclassified Pseudoclavibacter]|uniref:hypothetical protein n=1 Tax=unclassified Pseudoclavibacter TaxID=2615177 RepID=UPI002157B420|nr:MULTISPECIES: hypothetical protein [unclassified Pseudoclavibacter]
MSVQDAAGELLLLEAAAGAGSFLVAAGFASAEVEAEEELELFFALAAESVR